MRKHKTPQEEILAARLASKALGVRARCQAIMRGYIVDFYIPAWGLVIELDGNHHNSGKQKEHDAIRDSVLKGMGLTVLRFQNYEVEEAIEGVIETIRKHERPFSLRNMVIAERGLSKTYEKQKQRNAGRQSIP